MNGIGWRPVSEWTDIIGGLEKARADVRARQDERARAVEAFRAFDRKRLAEAGLMKPDDLALREPEG
jgi:hypothetical protein